MKRFYKQVSTGVLGDAQGYGVFLDGRPVKTPEKRTLAATTQALAGAIAEEWDAQKDSICPDDMPLCGYLSTRIDHIAPARASSREAVCRFIDTDLVCYRAGSPSAMVEIQDRRWQPVCTWIAGMAGTPPEYTTGLGVVKQPEPLRAFIARRLEWMDDDRLTLAQALTRLTGSVFLALAFLDRSAPQFDSVHLYDAMFAEEDLHAALADEKTYGTDPETARRRRDARRDLDAAARYLALLGTISDKNHTTRQHDITR